jgi:succinyl-CoA synthetase beta subunit
MEIFTERKSGIFLEKFGFNVVKSFYVQDKSQIKQAIEKIGFPCVVKVFGEKIIHKKRLGGVALNIKNSEEVETIFDRFIKIKDSEGIVLQKEIAYKKNEFLIGVQKTADFGHVVAFGIGGSDVEKLGKINFRVCPFDEKDALELVEENFKNLSYDEKKILINVLIKICSLIKKFSNIKELDINPLVIHENKSIILDSRIVFEIK